jgi:hypothetical protein
MGWPSLAKNPLRTGAVKSRVSLRPRDPCRGGHYLSLSAGRVGRLRRFPAVGQPFLDPAVGMRAHSSQDITQVAEGSIPSSWQVAHRLIRVAAVRPPSSLPAKSPFFRLCGDPHNRNYADPKIMRSRRQDRRLPSTNARGRTPHNPVTGYRETRAACPSAGRRSAQATSLSPWSGPPPSSSGRPRRTGASSRGSRAPATKR